MQSIEYEAQARLPMPADEHMERRISLHEERTQNQSTLFFFRIRGDSMVNAAIRQGDLLIVDKSEKPMHGSIVVVTINKQFCVRRMKCKGDQKYLVPDNDNLPSAQIYEGSDFIFWGTVTRVIHSPY